MLLAIDPGLDTGWALFNHAFENLVTCGLGDPRAYVGKNGVVVIERPQIYQGARNTKGANPNDLITLAIQVGQYKEWAEMHGCRALLVLPSQWKGQTPKDIHNARVWAALNPVEQRVVPVLSSSKRHNVLDAIGLGLWYLKRLKR